MSIRAPSGAVSDRLQGLSPQAKELARAAQQWLTRGDGAQAEVPLDAAIAESPAHPELLRLRGLAEHFQGRHANAIALFRKAAASWPQDGLIAGNLGTALAQHGDIDAALQAFQRATELDPMQIDAWYNLGRALDLRHDASGAYAALSAAIELDPRHRAARILRAEAAKTLGRIGEAEAELRDVLREDPDSVAAWIALFNLKSLRADAGDLAGLQRLHASTTLTPAQRIDVGFAYASALEATGDHERAFDAFRAANTAKRATVRWDARAVSALIDEILAAFPRTAPGDSSRGSGVAFLLGMPRSGSTLAEQIIAAHPAATAGGETGLIAEILQRESAARSTRFPLWAAQATDADWARLGETFLARIEPLRNGAMLFTDKTLTNWQTLGAIRRMLPGAHIVHCLRDPIETAWSCYKHNFASDQLYSYDFDELAAFFADSLRAMAEWHRRHPQRVYVHRYEDLLADPEQGTRRLLEACGLSFDPASLRFHEAEREVRTASAAQVRSPLRAGTPFAARYGSLLDPLRAALAAHGVRQAVR